MRTDRPGQSALLLLDAVEVLRREGVDYLVIGAFALSVHGVVRGSSDVDALLNISARRLAKLHTLFEDEGFGATLRRGDADDPIPSILVLIDRRYSPGPARFRFLAKNSASLAARTSSR